MITLGFNAAIRFTKNYMFVLSILRSSIPLWHFEFHGCSVRVSNELGAGRPKAAKFSVVVAVITSTLVGVVFTVVVIATKNYYPRLFSDKPEVIHETSKLAYFLAATIFLMSIQPILHGDQNSSQMLKKTTLKLVVVLSYLNEHFLCKCRGSSWCWMAIFSRDYKHRLLLYGWASIRCLSWLHCQYWC